MRKDKKRLIRIKFKNVGADDAEIEARVSRAFRILFEEMENAQGQFTGGFGNGSEQLTCFDSKESHN